MIKPYEVSSVELEQPASVPHKLVSKKRVHDFLNRPVPDITHIEVFRCFMTLVFHINDLLSKLQHG